MRRSERKPLKTGENVRAAYKSLNSNGPAQSPNRIDDIKFSRNKTIKVFKPTLEEPSPRRGISPAKKVFSPKTRMTKVEREKEKSVKKVIERKRNAA
jgi:hypothetical protein